MMFRVGRALAAGVAALLLLCSTAQAQVPDPYARELARQLAHAETTIDQQGFSRVAGPFAGGVPPRLNRRYPITLRAGQEYRIVGVCDSNCRDLDLRVYDGNDDMLVEDASNDDTPVVTIRPSQTGPHTIEVVMYRCSASPCYFAFNVYAR